MSAISLRSLRTSCLSQRPKSSLEFLLPSSSTSYFYKPQRRHATTSSTPSSTEITLQTSKINAPTSTLPALINTPVRTADQTAILYYIALGKAYVTFYKTGILNVKTNFTLARRVQASLKSPPNAAAKAGTLTRSEFQLLARSSHDIRRVPLFALVVLCCGELTPLVVIALSNVVPWTCRIPKQITSDRRKLEARRAISFRNLTLAPPKERGVDDLERMQLLHISWSLGLSSRIWDWLGGQLPGLPTRILRGKVAKRVEYLEADDNLIWMYGGVEEMSWEECKMAAVERGIDVLERKEGDVREDLQAWLDSREKVPVEKLLLTRPSVWPAKSQTKKIEGKKRA